MALGRSDRLPEVGSALAVLAHPDDESFGLGAVLSALVDAGTRVDGLCFTHGEASTLGATEFGLHEIRAAELAEAARALGVGDIELLDHPDGALAQIPLGDLSRPVLDAAVRHKSELLVVFDEGGITGHPDHRRATEAALLAADELDLPVVAWAVTASVAAALNAEFATSFAGRQPGEIDLTLTVDRARQRRAIACHRSQSSANPVLWRCLELTGDHEPLRWARRPRR